MSFKTCSEFRNWHKSAFYILCPGWHQRLGLAGLTTFLSTGTECTASQANLAGVFILNKLRWPLIHWTEPRSPTRPTTTNTAVKQVRPKYPTNIRLLSLAWKVTISIHSRDKWLLIMTGAENYPWLLQWWRHDTQVFAPFTSVMLWRTFKFPNLGT